MKVILTTTTTYELDPQNYLEMFAVANEVVDEEDVDPEHLANFAMEALRDEVFDGILELGSDIDFDEVKVERA